MASDRGGGGVGDDYLDDGDQEYNKLDVEDEGDPGDWQECDNNDGDIDQAAGYQLASQDDASVRDANAMEREVDCDTPGIPPFPDNDDRQPLACNLTFFPASEVSVRYRRH